MRHILDLIEEYAESRHINGSKDYNPKTAECFRKILQGLGAVTADGVTVQAGDVVYVQGSMQPHPTRVSPWRGQLTTYYLYENIPVSQAYSTHAAAMLARYGKK